MLWFGSRRRMARLERRFARMEQQNAQIVQALQHRHEPAGPNMSEILTTLTNGQVSQIGATGDFIKLIHDIAVDRMASAMGKRAGRGRARTAVRDERGRMRQTQRVTSQCPLCDDALTSNFSMAQWEEHQKHKGNRDVRPANRREEPADDRHDRDDAVEIAPGHWHTSTGEHIDRPQPQYPLPVVSTRHQDGGPSGDTSSGSAENVIQQTNGALIS